jgi:hypothetical protein
MQLTVSFCAFLPARVARQTRGFLTLTLALHPQRATHRAAAAYEDTMSVNMLDADRLPEAHRTIAADAFFIDLALPLDLDCS